MLDALLQEAAVQAGADLQPESRVEDLVRARDGRVCGVEVRRRSGGRERIEAGLVVGAGWPALPGRSHELAQSGWNEYSFRPR